MSASYSVQTSGDLIADRRFAYAEAAMAADDLDAALDLYTQTLELVPSWPPALFSLAKARLAVNDTPAAVAALRQVIALDAPDRLGAGVLLARLAGGPVGREAMPDAYIAGLFDEYAPRFDAHLTGALNYRAPECIRDLLDRHGATGRRFAAGLDLGCGTGLMAGAIQGQFAAMDGVDLSPRMLAIADRSGLYRRLDCAEASAFLTGVPGGSYDLVLAADVFCYVPDLLPVFAGAAHALVKGGLFAFSVQTQAEERREGPGAVIGPDARVHHARSYVEGTAARAGLVIAQSEDAVTRLDRGAPVRGAVFLMTRP